MNCTKAFVPSPNYLNFYYYYSYVTLFLCLLISPLLFYIILTKSSDLKSFKWLILNHSFWCLIWELISGILKPIFLSPAMSGFSLGYLRNGGNHRTTAALAIVAFCCAMNMLAALFSTVVIRYLLVFPTTLFKWFSLKVGIWICVGGCLCGYGLIIYIHYPILIIGKEEMIRMAVEYDPCMAQYFDDIPGLDFMEYEKVKFGFFFGFVSLILVILEALFCLVYFIALIRSNKNKAIARGQRSLIISSIAQLAFSLIFIGIPLLAFYGIISFQIYHTENLMCLIWCFFAIYSFSESCATLYFIRPYRKAVIQIFQENILCKKKVSSVKIISQSCAK